jgi:NADH:ubiquinone oxidoreductase subunit 2 (subunit N)
MNINIHMVDQALRSLANFLPETTLAITFCLALLVGLAFRSRPQLSLWVALLGVVVSMIFTIQELGTTVSVFSGMIAVDPFASFFKLLVGTCAVFIFLFSLYSAEVLSTAKRLVEYSSLLVSMTLGMYLMAGATNLLMMVLSCKTYDVCIESAAKPAVCRGHDHKMNLVAASACEQCGRPRVAFQPARQ